MTKEFATIKYALPEPGIARITLARPEKRNAQNYGIIGRTERGLRSGRAR